MKLLACVPKRISEEVAVELRVTAPAEAACVILPVSDIDPFEMRESVPVPTEEVPKIRAPESVKATLKLPLLLSETAPVKALYCVRVMAFAPVVKEEVPPTVKMPFCVKVPELIIKFCPMVEAAKSSAPLLVSETLLVPLLESVTAPVKALLWVKVMALLPAVKLAVPGTVNAPV